MSSETRISVYQSLAIVAAVLSVITMIFALKQNWRVCAGVLIVEVILQRARHSIIKPLIKSDA